MTDASQLRERVDDLVRPYLGGRAQLAPVVAVVGPGLRQVIGYGAAPGAEVAPGQRIYEIGSVSKVFTALLLARLAERGVVGLDDPVQRYLPPEIGLAPVRGTAITLAQLASHSAGLPPLPANLRPGKETRRNPYAEYTVEDLYAFLGSYQPAKPLPARVAYSNLGAGLLGHALARACGQSYEQAIHEQICAPFGMPDTGIALSPEQQRRLVPGHSARGRPTQNWDLPTLAGAGALRSCADDMLRFLDASLGLVETPLASSIALCQAPRARVGGKTQIGLGWFLSPLKGHTLIWHNGATGGYSSFVGLVKQRGVGVCVLANSTVSLLAALGLKKAHADRIGLGLIEALC